MKMNSYKKIKKIKPIEERIEFIRERAQRTLTLTQYCIANIAAYRANWKTVNGNKELIIKNDFWIRSNGNFLDAATLEWCKLFADRNGKHHWNRTFKDKKEWSEKFFTHMGMTSKEFSKKLVKIQQYRNKFVAHLDDPMPMNYPLTEIMLRSTSYLYDQLRTNEVSRSFFTGIYETSSEYYEEKLQDYKYEVTLREAHQFTS